MNKLLIVTNCFLLLITVTLLIKGNYYHKLLTKLHSSKTSVSDEQLLSMNNEYLVPFIDVGKGEGDNEINLVIIGNSITTHPISEKIGWKYVSGMAASSVEKDYVHVLLNSISNNYPNTKINFRISNFSEFERDPNNLKDNMVDSLVSFNPDIVVFQLGENVTKDNFSLFKEKYIKLIDFFKQNKNTATICTLPFFPSLEKNSIIENVSLETKSYLVDLSSLVLLDDENYVKNEKKYVGDKSLWKEDAIGIHPGDVGMKNIANRLLVPINILLDKNNM